MSRDDGRDRRSRSEETGHRRGLHVAQLVKGNRNHHFTSQFDAAIECRTLTAGCVARATRLQGLLWAGGADGGLPASPDRRPSHPPPPRAREVVDTPSRRPLLRPHYRTCMFSTRLPVSFILRHTLTLRPSLRRAVMTAPSLTPGSAAAIQMASPAVAAAAPGASIPPRWAAVTRPEELDALSEEEVRARYRPFVLGAAREGDGAAEGEGGGEDWVGGLELDLVRALAGAREGPRMRVAVLYGSLRSRCVCGLSQLGKAIATRCRWSRILTGVTEPWCRSFSRLTAYEAARVLARIGADVRVFDPAGLPLKDDASEQHPKVQELRALSQWSEAQLWCSPEQHGTITAVMKNQGQFSQPTPLLRPALRRQ